MLFPIQVLKGRFFTNSIKHGIPKALNNQSPKNPPPPPCKIYLHIVLKFGNRGLCTFNEDCKKGCFHGYSILLILIVPDLAVLLPSNDIKRYIINLTNY